MAGSTGSADPRNLSIGGVSAALPDQNSPSFAKLGDQGMLRIVSNSELVAAEDAQYAQQEMEQRSLEELKKQGVAGHIRQKYYDFRSNRESRGISARLLEALRAYRGQYSDQKLAQIREFGGSTVYSRLTALKCRGATAMLRDIYLAGERPWFVEPTPNPTLPNDVTAGLIELVSIERQTAAIAGQPISDDQIRERIKQLTKSARRAAVAAAEDDAKQATQYLDDMLVEGGFYDALVEFLHYLTVFPYAVMKGPIVRMATDVKWENGEAVVKDIPKMFWVAVNPMDIYWQSGIPKFADGDVIEHLRLSRSDLNSLLGVPGYDDEAIRGALEAYGNGGLSDWLDYTDTERARLESREDPHHNDSDLIDALEFQGKIQGRMLLDYGYDEAEIPDPDLDYACTAWLIDRFVLKVAIDASPRKRHNYYLTSFEKVPGGIIGHGLPEILSDIQDVANASLRALVNNLSIASGPQVDVNVDRLVNPEDADDLYPWKRWKTQNDPMGSTDPAVRFFQPNSNSQELLGVYQQMTTIADEISSIPRYMTGSERIGGAGRTASGLNMLMQNAGKVLQSVAANVDADIFSPLLQKLYDTVLLTDEQGTLQGDEQIRVRGVVFANQREIERTRILEFLNLTANPIDAPIVGPEGRAELLREVADHIGLRGKDIVPEEPQQAGGMAPQGMPAPGSQPAMSAEAGRPEEGLRAAARGPSGQSV